MNKLILPSAAILLILVIAMSSFAPAAAMRITLAPVLQVITIPQDDQLRQTGLMFLGLTDGKNKATDLMAQFKIIVLLNGHVVATSGRGITLTLKCNVIEKDKEALPPDTTKSKTVIVSRQFPRENLKTKLLDVADQFKCKPKWKPNGESVGVLDVYFIGPTVADYIADHILVVMVTYTIGAQTFKGDDMQDICILGWPADDAIVHTVTKSNGDTHDLVENPLGDWAGCEELALYERSVTGQEPFED